MTIVRGVKESIGTYSCSKLKSMLRVCRLHAEYGYAYHQ